MGARQEQLDFLRGFAAIYVLVNHVRGGFFIGGEKLLSGTPSAWDYATVALLQLTALGAEMVILFFVLSGFAMAHSVRHSSTVSRFYAKRIIRIWPPYIAAAVLALIIGHLTGAGDIANQFWGVVFYVSPQTTVTPQFWSLPYEVVFYALCPFILRDAKRAKLLLYASAMTTLVTLLIKGPMLNPWKSFLLNFIGNELILFALGAAAYHHYDRIPKLTRRFLLCVVAGVFVSVWLVKTAFGGTNLFSNILVVGATILAIRNLPPLPLNFGFFSYSIYIYHFALLMLAKHVARTLGKEPSAITDPVAWMPVALAILGCCYVLYLGTERLSNRVVESLRSHRAQAHCGVSRTSEAQTRGAEV